jgi:AcrR family transcriptional regulator
MKREEPLMKTGAVAPSGHEIRSANTRSRLIEAAIEVIGAVGYEGASTRALAKAAKANLSAIPYHFGGKKELYLAAAEAIAEYARVRFGEMASILEGQQTDDKAARFEEALVRLLHFLLRDAEPHTWTMFVARCAYDNDEAFALIHERAIMPFLEHLVEFAGDFCKGAPKGEAFRLRVSAIVTTIISFRFLRGILLRGMGWKTIQDSGARQIEEMIRDLCRSDFLEVRLSQ